MNTDSIIEEIKKQLTGDPQKDGPFLKDQSEKYKNEENSDEINRELAKLLYECAYNDMHRTIDSYLAVKNPEVNEKLKSVRKRYENLNYTGGIEILREIIKDNLFAWMDDDEVTYKSFGTPVEHALYMQIYQPEKEVRPVSCDLSEVYSLYGWGLTQKSKYTEAVDAFQRAIELNPTHPEIYIRYCELLKKIRQSDELRESTDKIMQCAVTKEQLGKGDVTVYNGAAEGQAVLLKKLYRRMYTISKLSAEKKRLLHMFSMLPYQEYAAGFVQRYICTKPIQDIDTVLLELCTEGWLEKHGAQYAMHPYRA